MPTMYIYHSNNLISSRIFRKGFYIIRDERRDVLYWKADDDKVYQEATDGASQTTGGGTELEIWIIGGASLRPLIQAVPEHWTLIIDSTEMMRRFYDRFAVPGRTTSLQYKEFRFECSFPGQPLGDITEVVKPATLR